MAINYTALKSEIVNDPAHYGYAQYYNAGDDVDTANLLNMVTTAALSAALVSGTQYTALPVLALADAIPAGATLVLVSGGNSGQVTVAAPGAAAGATSIPINAVTANAAYATSALICREEIVVGTVSTATLQNCVVESEFAALTAGAQADWQDILIAGGGKVDISQTNTRNQIAAIWGAGTQTRANLLQMQYRAGSRAETLFGAGTVIQPSDIGIARQS